MPLLTLAPRQDVTNPPDGWVVEDGQVIPFWWSKTGAIVKWSVFLGLILFVGLYLVLGYMHAKRRLRKGLMPLAYHRWLVSRRELGTVNPRYAYAAGPVGYSTYRPDNYGYGLQTMPPPVYDASAARPPVYEGPEGGSKTAPSQWGNEPTHRPEADEFAPPPGPPPAAMTATHTGSSNNPYRQ